MKLAENVVHFARVLREAGVPVGPDRVIDALRALEVAGVGRRDDFYWTLAAVFLDRREQFDLYDQAFHIFWRDPKLLERAMRLLLPEVKGRVSKEELAANRLAEAFAPKPKADRAGREPAPSEIEIDARFTVSDREILQKTDFETMTAAELAAAKKLIAQLRLPIPETTTRRLRPDVRGRLVDLRGTLRASLRGNADVIPLRRRSQARRHPPLVVLCDISGSMARYSRMFLHFLHAITNDRDRVHTFVFGTRLTNITRHLRHRDVDIALNAVSNAVADWSGGTRIGAALKEFNLRWSRRVLGQNAVVLLITDGLDRDAGRDLDVQMDRLHKSCRKLLWLNPLLRFEGFEPHAAGVRLMLPHVDAFLPAHNVESLADLARALTPAHNAARAPAHNAERRHETWT
ncbi:MAG TPA: VWA domain-containing protein [Burkholderiales bacterium]|nr:VWA domain-containing protein [Burkholderiales bacterium]